MKVVIFDLDSTLAHTQHRHHLIDSDDWQKTNWTAYGMASVDDAPVPGVIALVKLLHSLGVCVWILSGRSEGKDGEVGEVTRAWLHAHDVKCDFLTLRRHGDIRSNAEYKRSEIEGFQQRFPDAEILLMLDDWPDVAAELTDVCPVLLVNPNYDSELAGETRDDSTTA